MLNNNALNQYSEQLEELIKLAAEGNRIDPVLYETYNVKRGLRNSDGTGVLVGLTAIGEVHGYIMDENEKVDVHGRLSYRGIDVIDLIEGITADDRFGYEETIYLILFGKLPTREQLKQFETIVKSCRELPKGLIEDMILKVPSKDIMNKLSTCILGLYCYDNNPDDTSLQNVMRQSIELVARIPAIIAYCYHAKSHYLDKKSLHLHSQDSSLSIAENFLSLLRSDRKFTQQEAKVLDRCLILHAEHGGGNNSSFTTHVVASSGTDTYSAISAAVGSLKGPRHGGANAQVMGMVDNIMANTNWKDESSVKDYLAKIIRKEAYNKSGLVYGMGHAVYTLSDPRATILKKDAKELAMEKGYEAEYNLYDTIERLTPELFAEIKKTDKKISANVDLYSGFVYKMLDIDPSLYTPIFAMSRSVGWCAHLMEEVTSGGRIIRPAYKSICKRINYTPLDERE